MPTAAQPSDLIPAELAARLDRLSLVTRQRLLGDGHGERRSRRRGSSLEFADYRAYSPGDDPSRVDWNVYGRFRQLQVKVFEAEELMGVSLCLDASASMRWGEPDKFFRACQIAAALGYLALAGGNRVRVTALRRRGAERSRDFWGRRQAAELLRCVGGLTPDEVALERDDEAGSLERLAREAQRGAAARRAQLTILISDLLSATWQEAIRALEGATSELVVLHVLDREEINPSLGGDLNLVDQETGAREEVTLNAEVISWYQARVQSWLAEVADFCARRGVRYVRHVTSSPLEQWLFRDLRVRGVLR